MTTHGGSSRAQAASRPICFSRPLSWPGCSSRPARSERRSSLRQPPSYTRRCHSPVSVLSRYTASPCSSIELSRSHSRRWSFLAFLPIGPIWTGVGVVAAELELSHRHRVLLGPALHRIEELATAPLGHLSDVRGCDGSRDCRRDRHEPRVGSGSLCCGRWRCCCRNSLAYPCPAREATTGEEPQARPGARVGFLA